MCVCVCVCVCVRVRQQQLPNFFFLAVIYVSVKLVKFFCSYSLKHNNNDDDDDDEDDDDDDDDDDNNSNNINENIYKKIITCSKHKTLSISQNKFIKIS